MVEYDPQERELVKTLDRKIVPFLAVLYFSVLLDRSIQLHMRVTNPHTRAGLDRDLRLDDFGFVWSLISFGLGSLLCVMPSTLVFRKIGPAKWFARCFASWGLIAMSAAGITNWAGFLVTRLFLGMVQAGFLPCVLLYMVYFYTKEELATRLAYVITCATAAASISGLILHYIARMDGFMGLAGWQLTFVLEGLLAFGMAFATWMHLPNYPETCGFLPPADRVLAASRGRDGAEDDTNLLTTGITKTTREPVYRFHMIQLLDVVRDVRTWLIALAYFMISTALDSLIVLGPEVAATSFDISLASLMRNWTAGGAMDTVIADNEDGSLPANLLSTAPYLIACAVACAVATHSDNSGERAMHAAVPLLTSGAGFVFMAILPPKYPGAGPARYFMGLMPAVGGLITATPCVLAYAMDKAQGDTYRAAAAAVTVALGHAFGIAIAGSPDLFDEANAPTFPAACVVNSIAASIAAVVLLVVRWFNKQEEENMWGKAPGLRRLLNDADEAKAWDVELSDFDLLKSEGSLASGLGSGGLGGGRAATDRLGIAKTAKTDAAGEAKGAAGGKAAADRDPWADDDDEFEGVGFDYGGPIGYGDDDEGEGGGGR
nr:hypothetical protein HK105_008164 [Polyrhizophydium stewartii]